MVLHEDVDASDIFKTYKNISMENCRGLCGILSNCFGFSYDLEETICHLSNGTARVQTTKYIVSGNKSCIGDVTQPTNLQKECQYESTKAIGESIDKYSSIPSVTLCKSICRHIQACQAFTYSRNTSTCTLLADAELSDRDHNYVTGHKSCDGYIPNCFVNDFEYSGTDVDVVKNVGHVQECQKLCQDIPYCFFWTYHSDIEQCTRKSSVRRIKHHSFATSGSRNCHDSIIKSVEFTGYGSLDQYVDVKTLDDCQQKCQEDYRCSFWNLYSISSNKSLKICETRYSYSDLAFNHNCKSGYKWNIFLPKHAKSIDCSWEGVKLQTGPLDLIEGRVFSHDQCQYFCRTKENCTFWSYHHKKGKCFLFDTNSMEHLKNDMGFISGPKYCDGTCYSKNVRFNAKKILTLNNVKSPVTCQSYCKREIQCKGFNYVRSTNICLLVKEGPKQYDSEVISGIKTCKAKEKNVFVNLKDCYDYGVDYKEGDIMQVNGIIAPWECQLECQKVQRCNHWTYKKKCLLKTDHKGLTYTLNKNTVSGPKYCFEYKQDVDIKGGHFRTFREIKSAMICQKECDKNPRCLLFSYHPPKLECHLKTNGTLTYRKNFVASSKTVYNKNITTAISPIIQTVVRTPSNYINTQYSYDVSPYL
ncbi:unnamed protein product [Lepeophtheirus salmonis]|uniref:(salmon louse) hypothetical protein n=2 Tax=Lepeophtheirus salmonis TaxID=72036 RepID=A0A7R8H459_LEPSM|nr:unnamed protein product [Lepeophtheirus salmonis]CAF2842655.1 unnamed protein product [Lepeophtheirus salmonis]